MVWPLTRLAMGIAMLMGTPAPFVSAGVDAVDETLREPSPSHGMSTMPRAWLAFGVTAVLVTTSMGWARLARARLGTDALAALSWLLRHSKRPWDELLVARVRVILRHDGLTCGSLGIDDTATKRSQSAHTLAHLYNLRAKESGGYIWGQSLLLLLVVTPAITLPVGLTFSPPAPELSAWDQTEKVLTPQGVPPQQRPPPPPPTPHDPTKPALALRL
jgi:hypothetical protein